MSYTKFYDISAPKSLYFESLLYLLNIVSTKEINDTLSTFFFSLLYFWSFEQVHLELNC